MIEVLPGNRDSGRGRPAKAYRGSRHKVRADDRRHVTAADRSSAGIDPCRRRRRNVGIGVGQSTVLAIAVGDDDTHESSGVRAVVAVIEVLLTTFTPVAAAPPRLTVAPDRKPVP